MRKNYRPAVALLLALFALGGTVLVAGTMPLPAEGPAVSASPVPSPSIPEDKPGHATPEEPRYTLHLAVTDLPESWAPLAPEEGFPKLLRDCLSAGLYELDYAQEGGTRPVPALAQGEPEDVTALYADRLGCAPGERGRAWRILLRSDLLWQDGSPLTAGDFAESARRLLDPEVRDPAAALFTQGPLALTGARDYLEQRVPILVENARRGNYAFSELLPNEEGVYTTPEGYAVSIALDYPLSELLYGERLRFYVETYGDLCFDLSPWEALLERMDGQGLVPLTEESYELFRTLTTGNPAWGDTADLLPAYFVYTAPPPPVRWSEVGFMALDDGTLVLLLEKPVSPEELMEALTVRFLVKPELYDACAYRDGEENSNSYGSSPETVLSYGPYLLREWAPGKSCALERNPNYFAWKEGPDVWQTTEIQVALVSDEGEARSRFDRGLADACLLSGLPEVPEGSQARVIPDGAVILLASNPDPAALAAAQTAAGEGVNKTILTLPAFRLALSLSLDRAAFCAAAYPGRLPSLGLISPLLPADSTGVPYRDTEAGKAALSSFWGRAEESGGRDLERAGALFDLAWTAALETGLLTEEDRVELTVGFAGEGADFRLLTEQLTEAIRGTKLEGKLSLLPAEDPGSDLHATLRQNRADLLLGVGWASDPEDPIGLMEAYLTEAYRYDPAWKADEELLRFSVGGRCCTAPLPEVFALLRGETGTVTDEEGNSLELVPAEADEALAAELMAALEGALLRNADVIPLAEGCSTLLTKDRLELPAEDYLYPLGFGGLKYLRYASPDESE